MKKFTNNEIAAILKSTQSAEFSADGITYYLTIEDETYTASATPAAYGYTQAEWDDMNSSEDIYDRENLDDEAFASIVADLAAQVNAD